MAKAKKKAKKKVAKKAPARRSAAKKRASARKPARKSVAKRKPAAPTIRPGVVTHTELASGDPEATRKFCEQVLDWKFGPPMDTMSGPYHMFRFGIGTGGGIRALSPPEVPGSIPYCEVRDIRETYDKALAAGATEMVAPMALPSGMGWIAIVAAPGGVPMGFWAMK